MLNNYSYVHYASVWHVFPQPYEGWRDYIRKADYVRKMMMAGRLMIVFRRLLRTSESNTELYRWIHYNVHTFTQKLRL